MSEIEQLRNDFLLLKNEFETYKKSGFWQRRDVLKTGGIGLLALLGVSSAKADTLITDSGIDIGGLSVQLANHDHNGGDGAQINHTTLSNIGTNTHVQIDTHIATGAHVTGGDSHDHNGGDGAQINHTTLSNIGTNAHSVIDTHLAASAPHSGHALISTGTYIGNDTANRAIAHGLGRTPIFVLIHQRYTAGYGILHVIMGSTGYISYSGDAVNDSRTVTVPDATNFYVGNSGSYAASGNANTYAYSWIAIG